MEDRGFFPYYNQHIEFKLISGERSSGVIVDTLDSTEKLVQSWYSFIPSIYLSQWRQAEKDKDLKAMKAYERVIDIHKIVGAKLIA
jgi:hypothetical protein